jgi:hypothetical protein
MRLAMRIYSFVEFGITVDFQSDDAIGVLASHGMAPTQTVFFVLISRLALERLRGNA